MSLKELAKAVQEAADAIVSAATPDDVWEYQESYAKYGKAFVADVANVMQYPLQALKAVLPDMLQQGLIDMHRFDLASSAEHINESEVKVGRATFHQIRGYKK